MTYVVFAAEVLRTTLDWQQLQKSNVMAEIMDCNQDCINLLEVILQLSTVDIVTWQ